MMNEITTQMLDTLREEVKKKMSSFRLAHTLGVEEMVAKIGAVYCPEKENILRAAALLHDMTKELSPVQQKQIFDKHDVCMSDEVANSYPVQHAITASLEIPERYPEFADAEVISAVRYHTTGRPDMTLCEKIIYISDYIDFTRTYSECIKLRDMFWSVDIAKLSEEERLLHLDRVILESLDLTILDLIQRGYVISSETLNARNRLILDIKNRENR